MLAVDANAIPIALFFLVVGVSLATIDLIVELFGCLIKLFVWGMIALGLIMLFGAL